MQPREAISQRNEELRIDIRDKTRREKMSERRSQAFLKLQVSQERIEQLRTRINSANLQEHLSELKYVSINAKALNEFAGLAQPLLQLALQTPGMGIDHSEQYVYEDAMTILCNMVNCENFGLEDRLTIQLAELLEKTDKRMAVLQFYTNLFNLGVPNLFQLLIDRNLLTYIDQLSSKKFDLEADTLIFCEFLVGSLVYSKSLSKEQLQVLATRINAISSRVDPQIFKFKLCISLSRCSRELDDEYCFLLLTSFQDIVSKLLAEKKTKLIMALHPFLERLTKSNKALQLFQQQKLMEALGVALQSRNPDTKQIIITLMANLLHDAEVVHDPIFQSVFLKVKEFEREPMPVQMALAFFMSCALQQFSTEAMLSLLRNMGLVNHIRTLLQSAHNNESLNTGLLLLRCSFKIGSREFRVQCEQVAIHRLLEQLTQHQQATISQQAGFLLDNYFKF